MKMLTLATLASGLMVATAAALPTDMSPNTDIVARNSTDIGCFISCQSMYNNCIIGGTAANICHRLVCCQENCGGRAANQQSAYCWTGMCYDVTVSDCSLPYNGATFEDTTMNATTPATTKRDEASVISLERDATLVIRDDEAHGCSLAEKVECADHYTKCLTETGFDAETCKIQTCCEPSCGPKEAGLNETHCMPLCNNVTIYDCPSTSTSKRDVTEAAAPVVRDNTCGLTQQADCQSDYVKCMSTRSDPMSCKYETCCEPTCGPLSTIDQPERYCWDQCDGITMTDCAGLGPSKRFSPEIAAPVEASDISLRADTSPVEDDIFARQDPGCIVACAAWEANCLKTNPWYNPYFFTSLEQFCAIAVCCEVNDCATKDGLGNGCYGNRCKGTTYAECFEYGLPQAETMMG